MKQNKSEPDVDNVYAFDAHVCVEAESQEAAAEEIIFHCIGRPADIAISLHTEGTLNTGPQQVELDHLRKVETLAMSLCNVYFRSPNDIEYLMDKLYTELKEHND
jgi:hypothetical protein